MFHDVSRNVSVFAETYFQMLSLYLQNNKMGCMLNSGFHEAIQIESNWFL